MPVFTFVSVSSVVRERTGKVNLSFGAGQSTCELPRRRILSLGLGGGELHGFILEHFPCVGVDSVDLDRRVISLAENKFGLQTCQTLFHPNVESYWDRLRERDSARKNKGFREEDALADASSDEMSCLETENGLCDTDLREEDTQETDLYNKIVDDDLLFAGPSDDCRSRVYEADAWSFILTAARRGNLVWDVVIMDLFDATALLWSGQPGQGRSNAALPTIRIQALLGALKNITEKSTGIVILHIHKDESYEIILRAVKTTFRSVVQIAVGFNDGVIVASQYEGLRVQGTNHNSEEKHNLRATTGIARFRRSDWMCSDDSFGSVGGIVNFSNANRYSTRMIMSERFSVRGYP